MKTATKWYRKGTNERVRKSQVIAETKQAIADKYITWSIEKIIREYININFYCIKGEKNYEKTNNGIRADKN